MSFVGLLKINIIFRSLNVVINVLITLLLTRLMSVEGYGILSLMIANGSIFSLVSCLGAESGINYHYASANLQRGKIFVIVYSIIICQLVLLAFIETVHHSITGHYWLINAEGIKFLFWILLYLFSLSVIDKYTAFLNASHHYTLANKIIFVGNLFAVSLFGCLYFFYEVRDYFHYLQGFILITFIQAILLMFTFHLAVKQALKFTITDKRDLKLFFSYSFFAFIINIIQFLAYRVDFWLVDYYKGKNALGWYSLAVKLGQLFWVLPLLFASIILPLTADKKKIQDEKFFLSLISITNISLFTAGMVAFVFAGWLIPLFFGKSFAESVDPFVYMLPGFLLFGVNIMLAAWFAGKNKLAVNFIGTIICFLLVLVLDLWLIPLSGIRGAAIASSIAYGTSTVYFAIRFSITTKSPFANLFIPRRQDWIYIAGVARKFFKKVK